jgi:hypothetical protein
MPFGSATMTLMKHLTILVTRSIFGLILALIPVSASSNVSNYLFGAGMASAAVTQNVFCNDGFNGYTTDPAAFCTGHGGPATVANGQRPYVCSDKSTQNGPDAVTACRNNGGITASNNGKCAAGQVELSVPIISGQNCVGGNASNGGVIVSYLKWILLFLSGAVGAVIMLMLIIAGIQYVISTGDAAQVKAAKNRIVNAITALVLFAFMYAILNFLIPGGIFG